MMRKRTSNLSLSLRFSVLILLLFAQSTPLHSQSDLTATARASASTTREGTSPAFVADGLSATSWSSDPNDSSAWLMLRLRQMSKLEKVEVDFAEGASPNTALHLQYLLNGEWLNAHTFSDVLSDRVIYSIDQPLVVDRLRLAAGDHKPMHIARVVLHGLAYSDSVGLHRMPILANQSGYNLHRPKRFSAPYMADGTPFYVISPTYEQVYGGLIEAGKGDFSEFNPESEEEFTVRAASEVSFPFRIGPNWLERVSYRGMLDFMVGARHCVGNVSEIRPLSFEWRDGDFFNWSMQSLVALYASNPAVFERMEVTTSYVSNHSFPAVYSGRWGALEPYAHDTPDIVQLLHWDADVKVSMGLDHEMQKAELAHFLHLWPSLKQWLPEQNFQEVYEYATEVWSQPEVSPHATSLYDKSTEHDLLALKTRLGTTKGEMPPGYSVIPNLMMYEVALAQNDGDAERYFDAAYQQMEWMIDNLDWRDPITTKGQRVSEHITMRAFAYFFHQFPDSAPPRLADKVREWARVVLARSQNMWDFRTYDEDDWAPPGWNEPGNVLGFPAAAFAAMSVLDEPNLIDSLEISAWSHFENAFGRNPTGRHFSYKAPEEIEGVELGWYSRHRGGIGALDELPFVFDGAPKSFHYPNRPEMGNLGWTEGWVQFNTAYNVSMAYLAHYYTRISIEKIGRRKLHISLEAPINLDRTHVDTVAVHIVKGQGQRVPVVLREAGPFSSQLTAEIAFNRKGLILDSGILPWSKGDSIEVGYGLGYFRKTATLVRD